MTCFYGRAPGAEGDWLKVKPHILRMYATMLPRLEAEQELRMYRVAIASGELMMAERDRAGYLAELERQAQPRKRRKKPTMGTLEGMGIRVRKEPKGGDT